MNAGGARRAAARSLETSRGRRQVGEENLEGKPSQGVTVRPSNGSVSVGESLIEGLSARAAGSAGVAFRDLGNSLVTINGRMPTNPMKRDRGHKNKRIPNGPGNRAVS